MLHQEQLRNKKDENVYQQKELFVTVAGTFGKPVLRHSLGRGQ